MAASATLATKHRRRSTQQATTGLKITVGLLRRQLRLDACARRSPTTCCAPRPDQRARSLRAPARKPMLHLPAHWPRQTGWKTLWDNVIGHCYRTAQPRAG